MKDWGANLSSPGLKQKMQRLSVRNDETNDLFGWPQAAREAREIHNQLHKEGPAFIFGERYQIVSPLAFYMGREYKVYCLTTRRDQYKYFAHPVEAGAAPREATFTSRPSPAEKDNGGWSEKIEDFITRKKSESMVNYLTEVSWLKGQNALFLCDSRYFVNPGERFNFKKVIMEKKLVITRNNIEVRTFYFFKCYDFQGLLK